ncbi:MAG: metallopeptidase TldD-related protein [Candidatus Aenigmarchaeota archaeon]|nr:metallopeptidase TldD-related protein [Candidatus Aenigmarchaeota archaeon]
MSQELIKSTAELKTIAELLSEEVKNDEDRIVSRYTRVIHDLSVFHDGKESKHVYAQSNLNKELIEKGIYTQTEIEDLCQANLKKIQVARDLKEHRFHFKSKGISLPAEEAVYEEKIPTEVDMYDNEFKQFTKEHADTKITRSLRVEQKVIVNSKGGKVVQTIPIFGIFYHQGYNPIPLKRNLGVVCTSAQDVRNLTKLIKRMVDPTPTKRINNSASFSEAFHELFQLYPLKCGSLEEAGMPSAGLFDVCTLGGTFIHEIFGHHFEEPLRTLEFGDVATFKYDQATQNKTIILKDDPTQIVEGFRVQGFTYVDAYGRRREPRTLIEGGKVKGFLGSEYVDSENLKRYLGLDKSEFVGNAVQSDGLFPQPAASCTVIDGSAEDVDLEGKLLLNPSYGTTNRQDKTYSLTAFESYVIKNGKAQRLIPLQVTGGINQALANLHLLADTNYQSGVCNKPEPLYAQRETEVLVSQFTKSQLWAAQQVYPLPLSDRHLKILTKR